MHFVARAMDSRVKADRRVTVFLISTPIDSLAYVSRPAWICSGNHGPGEGGFQCDSLACLLRFSRGFHDLQYVQRVLGANE